VETQALKTYRVEIRSKTKFKNVQGGNKVETKAPKMYKVEIR